MSAESTELVQAQYYCRHLQLKKLAEEVNIDMNSNMRNFLESNEHSGWAFAALMFTPQVYTEAIVRSVSLERQHNLWELATKCLALVAKGAYSQNICEELLKASDPEVHGVKFVELDNFRRNPPASFDLAFATNPDALESGHMRGKGEAIDYLLGRFTSEVPLMRYRKDLLEKFTLISTSSKGIGVGYIPTVVTGLDLRLFYPSGSNMPNLSFYMKAFESET